MTFQKFAPVAGRNGTRGKCLCAKARTRRFHAAVGLSSKLACRIAHVDIVNQAIAVDVAILETLITVIVCTVQDRQHVQDVQRARAVHFRVTGTGFLWWNLARHRRTGRRLRPDPIGVRAINREDVIATLAVGHVAT